MTFRFHGTDRLETVQHQRTLRDFLHAHPATYPKDQYHQWVEEKVMHNLPRGEQDTKYAMMTVMSPSWNDVLGLAIYQDLPGHEPHWEYLDTFLEDAEFAPVEIKNFRIADDSEVAGLDQLLLQQFTSEYRGRPLVADVTAENHRMLGWFVRNGFYMLGQEELYRPGQKEVIVAHPNGRDYRVDR